MRIDSCCFRWAFGGSWTRCSAAGLHGKSGSTRPGDPQGVDSTASSGSWENYQQTVLDAAAAVTPEALRTSCRRLRLGSPDSRMLEEGEERSRDVLLVLVACLPSGWCQVEERCCWRDSYSSCHHQPRMGVCLSSGLAESHRHPDKGEKQPSSKLLAGEGKSVALMLTGRGTGRGSKSKREAGSVV